MAVKYDYILNAYGLFFEKGQRVRFTETDRDGLSVTGVVVNPKRSHLHYVQVRFDGEKRLSLCHPKSLIKLEAA